MAYVKQQMAKSKKNKNKPKLNLTVREEQRNKLEQMASLENRSVSNLIEVMANERWERLAEQQGVAYAKTVADAMNLKLDADNPADRDKFRRAILDLVAGRKIPKQNRPGPLSFPPPSPGAARGDRAGWGLSHSSPLQPAQPTLQIVNRCGHSSRFFRNQFPC